MNFGPSRDWAGNITLEKAEGMGTEPYNAPGSHRLLIPPSLAILSCRVSIRPKDGRTLEHCPLSHGNLCFFLGESGNVSLMFGDSDVHIQGTLWLVQWGVKVSNATVGELHTQIALEMLYLRLFFSFMYTSFCSNNKGKRQRIYHLKLSASPLWGSISLGFCHS